MDLGGANIKSFYALSDEVKGAGKDFSFLEYQFHTEERYQQYCIAWEKWSNYQRYQDMDRCMKYIESRPEPAAVQCGTQLVEGKTYLVGYLSASKGDFKENENSLSEEVTSESVEETSGAKPVYHPVYHVDIMLIPIRFTTLISSI